MKKALIYFFAFTLLNGVIISFSSCKKDDLDKKSTDNKGNIIFWQTKATSDKYKTKTVTYEIFVKSASVGYLQSYRYWNIAPDCGGQDAVTYERFLGEKTEETLQLQIRDDSSAIIVEGTVTIKNGECVNYEVK